MNALQKILTVLLCLCMILLTFWMFICGSIEFKYHIKWVFHLHGELDCICNVVWAWTVVNPCFYVYFCFWNSRKKKLMSILYALSNLVMLSTLCAALFSLNRYDDSPLETSYIISYTVGYAIPVVIFLLLYTLLWKFKDIRMWLAKKMHNAQRI